MKIIIKQIDLKVEEIGNVHLEDVSLETLKKIISILKKIPSITPKSQK